MIHESHWQLSLEASSAAELQTATWDQLLIYVGLLTIYFIQICKIPSLNFQVTATYPESN